VSQATNPEGAARVNVYGAGVAGLTVAHELALRGLSVRVVEKARGLNRAGQQVIAIGGRVGTDYVLLPADDLDAGNDPSFRLLSARPQANGPDTPSSTRVLPAENGWRFFAACHRHLLDTLRRIPAAAVSGPASSVFDRLVPAESAALAHEGREPVVLPRRPNVALWEAAAAKSAGGDLGYWPSDGLLFILRLVQFMSTCPDRRAKELESVSFRQFLEGRDAAAGAAKLKFSQTFLSDVDHSGRILGAFDGLWGDCRSNAGAWVRLFSHFLQQEPVVDGFLDGSTSESWLEPWRAHLLDLGVTFEAGELVRLELSRSAAGEPLPVAYVRSMEPGETGVLREERADYLVCAVDVVSAEAVTRALPRVGVPGDLDGYTTRLSMKDDGAGPFIQRDPTALDKLGLYRWDRLRAQAGLEFFFTTDFSLQAGFVSFADSEWDLSAVSNHQFHGVRPTLVRDGYVASLGVVVGAWNEPARAGPVAGRPASACTPVELAREVWRQIKVSLETLSPATPTVGPVVDPAFFTLDPSLSLDAPEPAARRITAPILIAIRGDYARRPGPEPWNPTPQSRNVQPLHRPPAGVWQDPRTGGGVVHWEQLVFAGSYLKTFTRLTSPEAANESGRHAANTILAHLNERIWRDREARVRAPSPGRLAMPVDASYRPSAVGEPCRIWNAEEHELPHLSPLRALDQLFFDAGLPHPFELLGTEPIRAILASYQDGVARPPWRGGWVPQGLVDQLVELVRQSLGGIGRTWPGFPSAPTPRTQEEAMRVLLEGLSPFHQAQRLLDFLRHIREDLEQSAPWTGGRPPPRPRR
jgi:uncharacterized protein with NAD-binding domain and iron-sulfur cluster